MAAIRMLSVQAFLLFVNVFSACIIGTFTLNASMQNVLNANGIRPIWATVIAIEIWSILLLRE